METLVYSLCLDIIEIEYIGLTKVANVLRDSNKNPTASLIYSTRNLSAKTTLRVDKNSHIRTANMEFVVMYS